MRVLFLGPSMPRAALGRVPLDVRPPARQGDVLAAVQRGATAIGIVDGYFHSTAAVWHKEILFALSKGVTVIGGGSMGALRAAECARFGMVPVGRIARDYLVGLRSEDSDVAVVHGPEELGYPLFSEPAVIYEPTLARLENKGILLPDVRRHIQAAARGHYYANVTVESLFAPYGADADRLISLYIRHRVDQKLVDAKAVAAALLEAPSGLEPDPSWTFRSSPIWEQITAT